MRIVSWNINGLRAAAKKGLAEKIKSFNADIIGFQEIKAQEADIMPLVDDFLGYHLHFSSGVRPGYSGVALFTKESPKEYLSSLELAHFDNEGRFQAAFFEKFCVINAYFPNGAGKDNDNSRVPYKLEFYEALLKFAKKISLPLYIIGDYNTAHKEIDLARPKENRNQSGFLPEECEALQKYYDAGFIDCFRKRNPEPNHYTWWSFRTNARGRNVGWRIDLVLANKKGDSLVKDAFIWPDVMGSDHCPVGVDVDL
jgi:exodeoxyribonuclease-3